MKNKLRMIISCLSIFILLLNFIIPVSADIVISDSEIDDFSSPEQAVRAAVNAYFEQRESFLNGEDGSYPAISEWYQTDEAKHIAAMQSAGISRLSSSLEITNVYIHEKYTTVYAVEYLLYLKDGTQCTESIAHEYLVLGSGTEWRVCDDAYYEQASGFASCSYIPPEAEQAPSATYDGSAQCIIRVATNELGQTENSDGSTKYGIWYGEGKEKVDWCVMFIVWCANQADISTSVIPKMAGTTVLRTYYNSLSTSRYHASPSRGGTGITPIPGDIIFFLNGETGGTNHVAIVTSVSGNVIYYIDGNGGPTYDRVESDKITWTSGALHGLARPAYSKNTHTQLSAWRITATHHWKLCENCGTTMLRAAHFLVENPLTGISSCSDCGYIAG